MGMILYDMAMSPNAKRARLGLAETGAAFERREVNLLAGEQKTAAYTTIHPLGRVPTLDDDGVVVWESGAILLYLADKFPAQKSAYLESAKTQLVKPAFPAQELKKLFEKRR